MNRSFPVLAAGFAGQLHAVSMTNSPLWIFPALPLLFFALQKSKPKDAPALGALYAAFAGVEVVAAQSYGFFAIALMFANRILFGIGLGFVLAFVARRVRGMMSAFISAFALVAWEQIFRVSTGTFYVPVSIGNALAGNELFSQMAGIGGAPLLSLLLSFFGCSLLLAVSQTSRLMAAVHLWVALLVPASMALYGWVQLHSSTAAGEAFSKPEPMRVRIVQGAVPTWTYEMLPFVPAIEDEILEHYTALSKAPAGDEKPDLIVWPESVLRPSHRSQPRVFEKVRDLARKLSTWFIVGSAFYESGDSAPLNGALSVSPSGSLDRGAKRWLLPLLEDEWKADDQPVIFESAGRRIGVVICVESVYPVLFNDFAGQQLDLIVVLVNDAGLGPGGREVHARRSSLRAIEMGVPVIHAAQHFDTRVFDSHGIEIARATKSGAQNIDVTIPLF